MEKVNAEDLKELSIQKNISFSRLLAAVALEDVLKRISESSYSKYLWLLNSNQFHEVQYRKNPELKLEYDFVVQKKDNEKKMNPGDIFTQELASEFLKEIFSPKKDKVFDWSTNVKKAGCDTQITLDASLDGMQVPLTLNIYSIKEEKIIPRKEEINLLLWKDKKVTFYRFPAENQLAEKFVEVIGKLELIASLKTYYDIYNILNIESIDGRKVKDYIDELCMKKGINRDEKKMNTILGYKNYTYMKKRWKKYLRSIHVQQPEWEEVIKKFEQFYQPIWEAMMADTLFFGDWMPELDRFLS